MNNVRYAPDKPEKCNCCCFWDGKKKSCRLGEELCYYILPPEKEKKKKSPCDSCPYGIDHPCIGYCIREICRRKENNK